VKSFLRNIYSQIYERLPCPVSDFLSDQLYFLSNRPTAYHAPAFQPERGLERGSVTFSIDFELAWGRQYSRSVREDCVATALRERYHVPQILRCLNEHDVPATWATVGHLFLGKCQRDAAGFAHPEMPRVPHFEARWKFTSGDWYQHDPCTNVAKDPAWYAPDLIEAILRSSTEHELGCHGFSHLGFGSYSPSFVLEAELDECIRVMKRFGVRPVSLVFPGNEIGKLDLIAGRGFSCVRAFPVAGAEVSLPLYLKNGLWAVGTAMAVDRGEGFRYDRWLIRLKRCVDKAAETHLNAHLCFHPSLPRAQMEGLLFPLIRYCAEQRDLGRIDVLTMKGLVEETEKALHREGRVKETVVFQRNLG